MDNNEPLVLLVTETNPQTQLFIGYLQKNLSYRVANIHPGGQLEGEQAQQVLALLDADHVDEQDMLRWYTCADASKYFSMAAFNLKSESQAAELLAKLHFQGAFYRNDSLEMVCKGINALVDGKLWLSRNLMTQMIEFYRQQQLNAFHPACGLTQRETELIGLLSSGASNTQIAEKLFVSEHTVKSHLYNIFRKIKVNNRIQAMNWARQHLGPMPPPVRLLHRENVS